MSGFKVDESVFDKLADILKKHDLSEIEYKDCDIKIRVASARGNVGLGQASQGVQISQVSEVSSEEGAKQETAPDFSKHKGAVKSPMVGTCYMASEPGSANFVEIGSDVQKGDPILIIEAMKVMNLIKAPVSGKIVHIAVANKDPIEYGQLLVVIE